MRWSGRSTRPVIFCDERVAPAEDVAADVDELVGVRGVRQVVGGEDQRLREAAVVAARAPSAYFLISSRILRLESGAVTLRSISVGVELPLVLQQVELLGAGLGSTMLDLLALLEEDAVHADFGLDVTTS